MRITITTDNMIYSDSMDRVASVKGTSSQDNKSEGGNLSSIADFQKMLGHEMQKTAPSKVPVGTGVRVKTEDTSGSGDTHVPGVSLSDVPVGGVDDVETYKGEKIEAPDSLKDIFHRAGEKYGVDERLLIAIAYHESRFDPSVTSSSGAMGVMQLMPDTAKSHGVENAYDPEENIMGAAMLVRDLLKAYDGDVTLAMAAYSDGMGAVKRAGGVPDTKQAKEFVSYINSVYPDGIQL